MITAWYNKGQRNSVGNWKLPEGGHSRSDDNEMLL